MECMSDRKIEANSQFFQVIEQNQDGFWAACSRKEIQRGDLRWFTTLDELVSCIDSDDILDYFVPTPFETKAARFVGVSKFELLAQMTNVVRVDLDPPKTLAHEERVPFLTERLDVLSSIIGEPTAVVDSGRGRWAYFKLAVPVSKDEARDLNRMLGIVGGSSDRQSYNPSQWARLPGSVNDKTGEIAAVVSVDPTRLLDPARMRELLMGRLPTPRHSGTSREAHGTSTGYAFPFTEEELSVCELPELELPDTLWEYIDLAPSTRECERRCGRTRSDVEQSIFNELCRNDWSDLWIHAFAFQNGLPRYMREFRRKSIWADLTISRARDWVEQEREVMTASGSPDDEYLGEMSPPSQDEDGDGCVGGRGRHQCPRLVVLKEVDGSRPGEIYARAAVAFEGYQGTDRRSLQRHIARLIGDGDVERVTGDDGMDRLVRTEKGDKAASSKFVPYRFNSYLPTKEGFEKHLASIERRREEKREERRPRRQAERSQQASFSAVANRRARHIYRTDLDGRLRIDLNGRKSVFYLQLLTPSDEIITALVHHQLHVGWDDFGYSRYSNALSPLEPALGGTSDPVRERAGLWPWETTLGVAARLHEADGGFELDEAVTASGEVVPAIGFLMEDTKSFWYPLIKTVPELDNRILRVERHGRWNDRSFTFQDLGPGLPISIPEELDLHGYVEEIASHERLISILASIPEHRPLKNHVR